MHHQFTLMAILNFGVNGVDLGKLLKEKVMQISNKYIVVEKLEEEAKEGFKTVDVQDNYVYKGKVTSIPEAPVFMGNQQVGIGSIVLFTKYSPDTHEIDLDGKKVKFVAVTDILAVL